MVLNADERDKRIRSFLDRKFAEHGDIEEKARTVLHDTDMGRSK